MLLTTDLLNLGMMIAIFTMMLWIRVSVFMTTDAAFFHSHHMQASYELGYHQQVLSHVLSRKLMIQEMVDGYGDQDFLIDNDQKEALLDEADRMGYDPARFTAMDYSHVRRRRPIHNNSSPKSTNSP